MSQRCVEYCREEREKLNVWVAYLNLENIYGQPPEDAVMKLFQRALQHVDQKKLYLALLAILENSNKVKHLSRWSNSFCQRPSWSTVRIVKRTVRGIGNSCRS